MQDFEKTFSDFIDGPEYDKAESDLLSVVRASYTAGWLAAGGDPPPPSKVVELMRGLLTGSSGEE